MEIIAVCFAAIFAYCIASAIAISLSELLIPLIQRAAPIPPRKNSPLQLCLVGMIAAIGLWLSAGAWWEEFSLFIVSGLALVFIIQIFLIQSLLKKLWW